MTRLLARERLLPQFAMLAALVLTPWVYAADTGGAQEQAQRQLTQPGNNAPFYREVRKGENPPYQTTQVRGVETNMLVQPSGQSWRQLRPPIALTGGLLIATALLAVFGFYWWRGSIGVHDPATGRLIKRFSEAERFTHWTVAISVCVLAITGLIISFGKYMLLPVLGYTLFSWIAIFAKNLHVAGLNIGGKPWTQAVHRAALQEILDLLASGKVKPVISQIFPMARVADAHNHLSNRKTMGKVILLPSGA